MGKASLLGLSTLGARLDVFLSCPGARPGPVRACLINGLGPASNSKPFSFVSLFGLLLFLTTSTCIMGLLLVLSSPF